MSIDPTAIVLLTQPVSKDDLSQLVGAFFDDMVKYVADLKRGVIALGGELHADGEELLLENGSQQSDLWGANYYPGRGVEGCIEYTSMINIRPAQGNRGMEIADLQIRERVRELTFHLIGRGEAALP